VRLVLVDTSALYAVLDADDANHVAAAAAWTGLLDAVATSEVVLVSHGGVVVEAVALVQRRLGMPAVRALLDDLLPVVEITWADSELYQRAAAALLAADRREVSLVDWLSFELMRRDGVGEYFAYDDDFRRQGFVPVAGE
jgi:uncharacterized protein